MRNNRIQWLILACYFFFFPLNAHPKDPIKTKNQAFVSVNFLLFGGSPDAVNIERLKQLSELKINNDVSAINSIFIPIYDHDIGQYEEIKKILDQFSFNVFTTTPMSADKDITSLDDHIGAAGVQFLKERVLITKKLGGKVLTGALLFPELKGLVHSPQSSIWPLDSSGNRIEPPALTVLVNKRLRTAVSRMQEVVDFAATHGIIVANEYINHWEICGGNTIASAIAFALEVNRPNFGILTDISHEVLQGKGPYIYAGELQLAKNAGLPIYLQISEPGRGDIVNSWLPFDQFFGIIQALDLVDQDHPLDIEIFDAIGLNPSLMHLTRDPFPDAMQVLIDGIRYTHQRYEQVPDNYKYIPPGALSAAKDLIDKERNEVYQK